jgi:hypothetical protein
MHLISAYVTIKWNQMLLTSLSLFFYIVASPKEKHWFTFMVYVNYYLNMCHVFKFLT